MESNIDISKYKKRIKGNQRDTARRAWKKWKNGLPISNEERYLIKCWYPFLGDD